MSLLVLVNSGEDGLVDAEAHRGCHQSQGEVSNHAVKKRYKDRVYREVLKVKVNVRRGVGT